MKSGFQTSELYVAVVGIGGILYSFIAQNCQFSSDKIIALTLVIVSYIGSRTYLKGKVVNQPVVNQLK